MEACPLEFNSPWCSHQFVVSAVGIVTQLPLSLDAAAGTDSNGGFLISPGEVDIKKVEIAQTWAPGQRCLTYSWGPPGDFQASIPPLHNEKIPPATKSKPEGTAHSTSAKPGEAKEQRKPVMFYCRHGPIKAFHSDFHGEHFILMVSMDRPSTPVRFRGADGAGIASPWWVLTPSGCRHPSWPCCCLLPPLTASETQNNPFGWGGFETLNHDEPVTLPYISLSPSVSPQWLSWLETVQATVFIFRAEQNVSGWQLRLASANCNLVELNMVSSLAPWPFLERAVLSWYCFLASHCSGENKSQGYYA